MRWKKRRPPAQRPAQMQAEPRQRMQEGAMAWQAGPAAQSQAAKNPAQAGFFDGRNNPAGRPGEARSGGLERLMRAVRSEEHTSALQSLMRISYAVFCLKKKI